MIKIPHYLIIGHGRVARHFQHYFSLLGVSFESWHRKKPVEQLSHQLENASHVLLLVNDESIETVIEQYLTTTEIPRIHFSGSLISDKAYGTHPLMSFGENLLNLEEYQSIPFILDHDTPEFEILFPNLPNPHWRLHKSLKAKYHALCVLSGNFTAMLWHKLFQSLEKEFNLPSSIAHAYILQIAKNIIFDSKTALTGPLVRNDTATIEKNLTALDGDLFQNIYQSFVLCYQQQK